MAENNKGKTGSQDATGSAEAHKGTQHGAGAAQTSTAKDFAGNPEGTTYDEKGRALPLDMGFTNLPQDADSTFVYNEDGSLFKIPADFDKLVAGLKERITGLNMSISKKEQLVESAKIMMDMQEEEAGKKLFESNINSIGIAIESEKAKKTELQTELDELKLSAITPAQRNTQRQLESKLKQLDALKAEIEVLNNKIKAFGGTTSEKASTGTTAKPDTSEATPEQKARKEALVKEHGSQGKAVIHLLKQGMLNKEVAEHLGIHPASVPGPKNEWLKTEEGKSYKADAEGRLKKA